MEIGETLYVTNRDHWRQWLESNHKAAAEIWLIFYSKKSGKPRLAYDEAVEEALCFGWIDSIVKKRDEESTVQRFSPRRKKSNLSELNRARIKKMVDQGKMTQSGLDSLKDHLKIENGKIIEPGPYEIPEDIKVHLMKDAIVWKNIQNLPEAYLRIRISFIDNARSRPEMFIKRLHYFIKKTRENKMFGSIV